MDKHGYYQVKLYKNNNTTHKDNDRASYLVHRLVACTFIEYEGLEELMYKGRYSNGLTVDHIDGNKTNNYYKNLRWVTFLDNCNYAKALGYNNPEAEYSHISEEVILKVIDDICNLYSDDEVMERNNVSQNVVSRIRQRRRWKHLTENIKLPKTYAHQKRDDILTCVYYAIKTSYPAKILVDKLKEIGLHVSSSQIYYLRNRKSCVDYIKYIEDGKFEPSTTIQ